MTKLFKAAKAMRLTGGGTHVAPSSARDDVREMMTANSSNATVSSIESFKRTATVSIVHPRRKRDWYRP